MELTICSTISRSFAFMLGTLCLSAPGCTSEASDTSSSTDAHALGQTASALEEGGPIRVLRATRFPMSRYGSSWTNVSYTVLVDNRAFDKTVEIVAQADDGSWQSIPASYRLSVGGKREIWEAHANLESSRFAAKYEVGGKTYWDNNGGQDYTIVGTGANLYNSTNILQWAYTDSLSPESSSLGVSVTLRNLSYTKNVNIVYTTDHWATVRTAPLRHSYGHMYGYGMAPSPNEANVELWQGSAEIGTSAQQVEYAIAYEANGQTYWDNAFGANYVAKRPGASPNVATPTPATTRDVVDTSCAIRLLSLGVREYGTRGNYHTDCSYRPSTDCTGRLMWFGQVRVSKQQADANAQVFVRYQSTDEPGTWKETQGTRAASDADGSVFYDFDFAAIPPGPDDGTQGIELIPFLLLPDGTRMFDHNANTDPSSNYRIGSRYREPGSAATGWGYSQPTACSTTRQ